MELAVTEEQLARWKDGDELIQVVFPHLTDDEREFLMSGATPEEWAAAFSECPGCAALGDEPCSESCPERSGPACRRCSECEGEEHHWLAVIPEITESGEVYVPCKHCSARAPLCTECCEAPVLSGGERCADCGE